MAKPDPFVQDRAPYEDMPETFTPRARLAPEGEPGEPLIVTGRVLGTNGKPRSGIIVYAHQANAAGVYPEANPKRSLISAYHGSLRAWAKTDDAGRYTFDTIKPLGYREEPRHMHMHVIEPGCASYVIEDVLFADDPTLTPPGPKGMPRKPSTFATGTIN